MAHTVCSCGLPMVLDRGAYLCTHCDVPQPGHIGIKCARCLQALPPRRA